ncbi:hypothetical protein CKO25_18455 [Thiocapsa imhoffii]|uniref:Uncharacterized protein n=1 Tax=Thiocapsa imhoffii TaxID=382777 RepID=A0A9X0WL40_9GAMM|nr:hypothetical protein [Thiocapsa imhoffii]MBK1646588.1 hypothetical protein [Thiocapsa imhoffii]
MTNNDEPLSRFGFFTDWRVPPKWNLCNAPGEDGGKVKSVKTFPGLLKVLSPTEKTILHIPSLAPGGGASFETGLSD